MASVMAPPPLKHETLTAMQTIITTVDRHAREHNLRWGFNRLPHLVPIAETERFVRARHKWNIACFECAGSLNPDDLDRVRKQGEALMRGFDHLARLAIEAGHDPLPATTWEFELEDGTPVILVRDRAELSQVDTGGRTAQVWSLDEIATIPQVNRLEFLMSNGQDPLTGLQMQLDRHTHPKSQLPSTLSSELELQVIYSFS